MKRRNQSWSRALFEQAGVGVAQIETRRGRFERINRKYCDIVGYSTEEMLTMDFPSITHPDDLRSDLDHMKRLIAGEIREFTMEKRYFRKDGSIVWVALTVSPMWRPGEEPDFHIAVVQDINERKLAERALLEKDERIRLLLNSTAEAIYGLDLNGLCSFANSACIRILGYGQVEDLVGRPMHKLIHHTRSDGSPYLEEECRIYQAFREGRGTHVNDEVLWRADGTSFPAEYWSYPIVRDGQLVGSVVTFWDISQRKQGEAVRELLINELEEKNLELERFAYAVSHDLKAPLRAVEGFGEILANRYGNVLDEKGQRCLHNIIQSTKRMEQLIADLLAYARLGSRGVPFKEVSLSEIVESVTEDLSSLITESGATITIADDLPMIRGNRSLLRQIFVNLLNNALTYHRRNEPPQVVVRWRGQKPSNRAFLGPSRQWAPGAGKSTDGNDLIVVEVVDNGLGIAAQFRDKIFDVFQRLHSDEDYPGTGIGLAMVRKAAQILGGEVLVESTLGSGSTFSVVLPHTDNGSGKD